MLKSFGNYISFNPAAEPQSTGSLRQILNSIWKQGPVFTHGKKWKKNEAVSRILEVHDIPWSKRMDSCTLFEVFSPLVLIFYNMLKKRTNDIYFLWVCQNWLNERAEGFNFEHLTGWLPRCPGGLDKNSTFNKQQSKEADKFRTKFRPPVSKLESRRRCISFKAGFLDVIVVHKCFFVILKLPV